MTKRLGLSAMHHSTHYAPLAALGAFVQQRDFFAPLWEHVQLGGKTIDHEPHQKLRDVVVSMLADCSSLKQIHTRLRPDTAQRQCRCPLDLRILVAQKRDQRGDSRLRFGADQTERMSSGLARASVLVLQHFEYGWYGQVRPPS